jgi:hypothetical protein
MNQYEKLLFLLFVTFYLPTFALYHFMIFRVNRHLDPDHRIRHSISWGAPTKLEKLYRGFYPRSSLYSFTRSSAVILLILALAMVALRAWDYVVGR